MPKRPCTQRAGWRFLRGKPAQPLPAHYRLDCDYGTALITIYREGEGDNPVYLCERHAAAERDAAPVPRVDDSRTCDVSVVQAAAGSVETTPVPVDSPTTIEARSQVAEVASVSADPQPPPKSKVVDISAATTALPKITPPPSRGPIPAPPSTSVQTESDARPQIAEPPAPKQNVPARSKTVSRPASKAAPPRINSPSKGAVRDLTYGNPAKALVDETIWNLAPGDYDAYRNALRQGKSALEAAQAAGGQLAVVHRKIHEYASKMEGLLSGSKVTMNVNEVIQSVLEREILNIIADNALADAEKDMAVEQLGRFQESINRDLRDEMTPLQAQQVALAIAERAAWGAASSSISSELRPVYRAVYTSIKDALRVAVPDARELDERLSNLYAARSDLDTAPASQTPAPADLPIAASAAGSSQEQKFAEI